MDRINKTEKYVAKEGDKREFAISLHSHAQDLSWAASSFRLHNDFYIECCRKISELVENIPSEEADAKNQLASIVEKLLESVDLKDKESSKDLEKKRAQLARDFNNTLEELYPLHIEFHRKPKIKRSHF